MVSPLRSRAEPPELTQPRLSPPLRLSLVVPVYNVAAYLPQCLDSLAALDPAPDEIIAVDDGSSDASPAILADYAARLPHLRVVRQANGGASVARNTGLDLARGRYLAFVDADDFLPVDTYANVLDQAEREQLDVMMFNGWYHFEGREADRLIYPALPATAPLSGAEWIVRHPLGRDFLHYPPLNLYRRDFLVAAGLRFIPGQKFHEDVPWTTEVLLAARRVAYDPTPWYFYRKAVRRYAPEQLQARLEAIVDSSIANAESLDALLAQYTPPAATHAAVAHQLVDGALSIFHKLAQMPDRHTAARLRRQLRRSGLLRRLWRHARERAHRRRIARQWLRSFA